jgi:hypothetical protein
VNVVPSDLAIEKELLEINLHQPITWHMGLNSRSSIRATAVMFAKFPLGGLSSGYVWNIGVQGSPAFEWQDDLLLLDFPDEVSIDKFPLRRLSWSIETGGNCFHFESCKLCLPRQ